MRRDGRLWRQRADWPAQRKAAPALLVPTYVLDAELIGRGRRGIPQWEGLAQETEKIV